MLPKTALACIADSGCFARIKTLIQSVQQAKTACICSRILTRSATNSRKLSARELLELQGCDCAANWLILANSDPNFVISEISVNQVRKCFCAWGVEVFSIQEQPCKCHNCRIFPCILANFASGQSHP